MPHATGMTEPATQRVVTTSGNEVTRESFPNGNPPPGQTDGEFGSPMPWHNEKLMVYGMILSYLRLKKQMLSKQVYVSKDRLGSLLDFLHAIHKG